jgi:hypothetical protein
MTPQELFVRGFMDKCAEHNVDGEDLLKQALLDDDSRLWDYLATMVGPIPGTGHAAVGAFRGDEGNRMRTGAMGALGSFGGGLAGAGLGGLGGLGVGHLVDEPGKGATIGAILGAILGLAEGGRYGTMVGRAGGKDPELQDVTG